MTILEDRPLDGEVVEDVDLPEARPGEVEPEEKAVKPGLVCLAAALTCLGGVWMTTRVFHGSVVPPLVGALGVLLGVGLVYASYRLGKGGALQYAVLPSALVVGAVLATTGDVAGKSLPAAITDAFRGGGLLQPPIPFDPGWRFLLVVLFAFVGAAASGIAVSLARPKLAVAVPAPIVLGASLIQPEGTELVASGVAMVFVIAGLAVAFGADLASEGVGGAGFEFRRLGRGVALMAAGLALLVVVAQSDFLFPATDKNQVIPPQKPPPPPPEVDRELFTVTSPRAGGPWRLGVLDVYDDNGWMLPSVDPGRMRDVPGSGVVAPAGGRPTFEATFSVKDMKGQALPGVADLVAVKGLRRGAEYDPRTQMVKLAQTSLPQGLSYTVVAPLPVEASVLVAAGPAGESLREFVAMPEPPPGVQELLARAPSESLFERLQFVRNELYSKVVASGAGRPGDVPPSRVDDMLAGGQASPFEINAAEAMLARWAGVPARLGFGFYGGDAGDGVASFRPRHGAAWLEAYFEGAGWVPILGTPPRAKASLSDEEKQEDPRIVPSEELGVTVFVPVRLTTIRLLYELVRYYVLTFGPLLLLAALALFLYPGAVKAVRSGRRRRWALGVGPVARVAVAYAEVRDALHDLNAGQPTMTPVEFLSVVEPDEEHAELAWLVTRALWGDLRRDLRIEDVEACEDLASSVRRRMLAAQTPLNRVLALASRASLREPWSTEVPNLWRVRTGRRRVVRTAWRGAVARLRPGFGSAASVLALVVLAGAVLGGCGGGASASAPSAYPDRLLPDAVGPYSVAREQGLEDDYRKPGGRALVSEGRVFIVRSGQSVEGTVQVSVFKPEVDNQDRRVQEGVQAGLGGAGRFRLVHFGLVHLWEMESAEQRVYLWFPPERNVMELFVMRKKFADAERVVHDVIRYQRGLGS